MDGPKEGDIGGRRPSLCRCRRPVKGHQHTDLLRGPESSTDGDLKHWLAFAEQAATLADEKKAFDEALKEAKAAWGTEKAKANAWKAGEKERQETIDKEVQRIRPLLALVRKVKHVFQSTVGSADLTPETIAALKTHVEGFELRVGKRRGDDPCSVCVDGESRSVGADF